ncbi:sensor histidine kinase [Herbidospora sp. RD11066]
MKVRRRAVSPQVVDGATALVLFALVVITPSAGIRLGDVPPPVFVLLGAVSCGALAFRRRAPQVVLAVTTVVAFVYPELGGDRVLDLMPAIALYTVATRTPRRRAWLAGAVVALALGGWRVVSPGESWLTPEVLAQVAWVGMPAAVGDAVRSRRAYVAAIEDRARRAEESKEEEAERRVMEERLRIARELHDVLAHHIALMNVQAQVAEHGLDHDVEQSRQALRHVRHAGKQALGELRTTVGLLRGPGVEEEWPTEPSPGLDRLPDLVSSFTAAGLRVRLKTPAGRPDGEEVPVPVELAAFRIVQEALTNVSKHAPAAHAQVRLAATPSALSIEVSDDGGDGRVRRHGDGDGHGLIGMRERALSLGGRFTAGPRSGGGFRVYALLPYDDGGR